jgi:hypothetical protein
MIELYKHNAKGKTGQQQAFHVDGRGSPEVVIMRMKDFLKTIAPEPEVLRAIRAEAKKNKTSKLTSWQIDQEITAYRRERRLKNATSKRRS